MTVHLCPPEGSGEMPCCGRSPFEVPRTDRITEDVYLVTCGVTLAEAENKIDYLVWALETMKLLVHRCACEVDIDGNILGIVCGDGVVELTETERSIVNAR